MGQVSRGVPVPVPASIIHRHRSTDHQVPPRRLWVTFAASAKKESRLHLAAYSYTILYQSTMAVLCMFFRPPPQMPKALLGFLPAHSQSSSSTIGVGGEGGTRCTPLPLAP